MWDPFKYALTRNKLVYSDENYLMIGNTRWHWASKIKKTWEFFHTSPNPIEFKNKDYSQLTWASVGPVPKNIKLCSNCYRCRYNLKRYKNNKKRRICWWTINFWFQPSIIFDGNWCIKSRNSNC